MRDKYGRFCRPDGSVSVSTKHSEKWSVPENAVVEDIAFNPQYETKSMLALRDWLKSNHGKFHGVSSYAWAHGNGKIDGVIGDICHHRINGSRGKNSQLVGTAVRGDFGETCRPFYEWLLTESPYKRFILSDLDFIEYGIIVSSDMPANVLQNIMILSRMWEINRPTHDLFASVVKNGVPGWMAYGTLMNTYSSRFEPDIASGNILDKEYSLQSSGHRAHYAMDLQQLALFSEGRIGKAAIKNYGSQLFNPQYSYKYNQNFRGGVSLFSDEDAQFCGNTFISDIRTDPPFVELLSSARRKKVETSVPDPFSGQRRLTSGFTYRDVVDFFIPYALERVEAIKNRNQSFGPVAAVSAVA